MTRSSGDRYLNSFALTDGTNATTILVNQGRTSGSAIYLDKTSEPAFATFPGASVRFSSLSWSGEWMHGYLFIDYDGDGEYDSELNADGTGSGELVCYSYYNGTNSIGAPAANNGGVNIGVMPSFTLPADLAPGDYKALMKVDWNDISQCGASDIGANGGAAVEFTITINGVNERTVTVSSNDPTRGSVAIKGHESTTVTIAGPVTLVATPVEGNSFINWTNAATNETISTDMETTLNGNDDISVVGNFGDLTYPVMKRTFTNNSTQQNRYLKRVTTENTRTPEVFNATTTAQLPYTAFTSSAGTYVTEGANIDKTGNPIIVEHGMRSFSMTYYGWQDAISGNSAELGWTQEACFVDWNGDGRFSGSEEISAKGWSTMPNNDIYTGFSRQIEIPAGQAPGDYRMRVVFFEPASSAEQWQTTLFTTLNNQIRNGISYDFTITIADPTDMEITGNSVNPRSGRMDLESSDVVLTTISIETSGSLNPIILKNIAVDYTGTATTDITNLRWIYSTNGLLGNEIVASTDNASATMNFTADKALSAGSNYLMLIADANPAATLGNAVSVKVKSVAFDNGSITFGDAQNGSYTIVNDPDYTRGNALWFDTANSSTTGVAIWNTNDFSTSDTNPDQTWERKSFPIGNGSFGGNILGSVNRERVVLNEKTLWKGGPGTGASTYWDMNRTVSDATLSQIRTYLENGQNSLANSLVVSNYSGKINYDRNRFGVFTTMGEAYVSTGIADNAVSDYKRIINIDKSLAVVQFTANNVNYRRKYFCSYPDNVMVWNYTSDGGDQNLTFSFNSPQNVTSVEAVEGGLLYKGKLTNNNMQWAMRVYVRTNGQGTVTPNASDRTITVSSASDVDFILAADTDYKMNFNPSTTDASAFVGEDPVANINEWITAAAARSYDELYDRHFEDYSALYGRTSISINPHERFENLPTPTRLANYRRGTLDHGLEQMYFQYGRYLLISSSRAGNMPANLQGMWHNNTDGPWRVDYHNNINLQMNYWPATNTNLLECFTPLIDYVRGLVEPGKRTASAYYGARGWTAEVSTNIFGFTAPLNSSDMSWNYNPTAGPWLASQLWEYYDYTRDKNWLRETGYDIIKESANFCSDLLYKTNGTYTSAPSYSPEHGTADLGATYANAVTREVLSAAIKAATILDVDKESVAEWKDKLDNMYPYQIGRYGQLQEWYNDIDAYGDTHRHTNHLFGLHPGTTINPIEQPELADACKETLRQRGDAATGWSMGWKLNHWARLLDGDHAYTLFQNLLKEGTADNMWDLHPPFQIDGNFGGTAGVAELFLQSHSGKLHLLPALPSEWTDGNVAGLLARGNFEVDIRYENNKLDYAVLRSNAGEPCEVRYDGKEVSFETEAGGEYVVRYDADADRLLLDNAGAIGDIIDNNDDTDSMEITAGRTPGNIRVTLKSNGCGQIAVSAYTITGQLIKTVRINKTETTVEFPFSCSAAPGCYILKADGPATSSAKKFIIR
ncbi:MAG: glycoside hydrolase N-terminal domain-containing protein [Paramuribaculum sp.]|nr:glycoside hydrolase N-terminal domain-containing protein [Paramuribaculum sp.]